MPREQLRRVLEELHDELEGSERIDDDVRALLQGARADIEEALNLEEPQEAARTAESARGQLGKAIERFEREHPEGVEILQRVLHALSNVGI